MTFSSCCQKMTKEARTHIFLFTESTELISKEKLSFAGICQLHWVISKSSYHMEQICFNSIVNYQFCNNIYSNNMICLTSIYLYQNRKYKWRSHQWCVYSFKYWKFQALFIQVKVKDISNDLFLFYNSHANIYVSFLPNVDINYS